MGNSAARMESKGLCGNPECRTEFKKKRSTQTHCTKRCRNRHSFLRLLAKRRSEAAVTCPDCGSEFWVGVTPKKSPEIQPSAGPGGQLER